MFCITTTVNKVYAEEGISKNLAERLKKHVVELSQNIGERNFLTYDNLNKAADYIIAKFKECGYGIELQTYTLDNKEFSNIIAEKQGSRNTDEIIVVGAHYDSVIGSPGADDNASAVAGLLELARIFSKVKIDKTIKFIAFVNEEPPLFQTKNMGSHHYAKRARQNKENIVAMLSLEMIGYYDKKAKSQSYPLFLNFFYPGRADYVAFVSNFWSKPLLDKLKRGFVKHSKFHLETLVAPTIVPGVDWSDHYSFWKYDYRAIMVTDTAFYRYPYYHGQLDTYEKLDYASMSFVVEGLYYSLFDLAKIKN